MKLDRSRRPRRPLLALVPTLAWVVSSSFACTRASESSEHGEEHERAQETEPEPTTLWVEVTEPRDASLIELPARVVASAESRARIETPLRGAVVSVSVRAGDRVEVGDPIVELRIPEVLEAAAILAGTSQQIGSHKARRERLEELEAAGLVGAGEVFDVESGLGRLSAERRLALATLAAVDVDADERRQVLARGTVILRSPIVGVVARIDAVPGDVVEPGEGLTQILGRGPARIELTYGGELPELVLEGSTPAAEAEEGPPPAAPPLLSRWGRLEFRGLDGSHVTLAPQPVATAIEPGLGRVVAWYTPSDPELELPDGVRGHVELHSEDSQVLEIPAHALRLDDGRAWVGRKAKEEGGEIEMIEVRVLRRLGSSALIQSEELSAGDRVAADAATVLTLGREPGELGGGHHH